MKNSQYKNQPGEGMHTENETLRNLIQTQCILVSGYEPHECSNPKYSGPVIVSQSPLLLPSMVTFENVVFIGTMSTQYSCGK